MKFLVSIIIPTYNRAHLIAETLDSIIAQTYSNWECIVVDDGSKDKTEELIKNYCIKDNRIQFHKRPKDRSKGGNTCRNYGFELSKGDYVKWFDSDDIMHVKHLEVLVTVLEKERVDFVVGDSVNFKKEKEIVSKPYNFDRNIVLMNPLSYAKNEIGWITDDFIGKRAAVEHLKFNEKLSSGQEYNYFIRLLHYPFKGIFVNKILSYRRTHSQSITSNKEKDVLNFMISIANIKFQTANDLVAFENHELICWFLSGYMKNAYEMAVLKQPIPNQKEAFKLICRYSSIYKGLLFIIALFLAINFNKGYNIMKYARS